MLLQLQDGILYGPIDSRRLGASLGINLMPGKYKLCSFNCVYCHYGWTQQRAVDLRDYEGDLPALDDVVRAVDQAFLSKTQFDYLTFSGNGESTIYPRFPELVYKIVELRDRHRPGVKIALLSNSSSLVNKKVRKCISKIDLPVFKLDAGTEKKWRIINRPAAGVDFDRIIAALVQLSGITLQTVFFDGTPSNTSDEDLEAYFEKIKIIRPVEVHIYSIDRPVPDTQISLVSPERLEDIAARGRRETGVRIRAFYVD